MFENHQPIIGSYAQKNADNFFQVVQFVLLTIQQSLHVVPDGMQDVNEKGEKSINLWGVKKWAWQELRPKRNEVYDHAMNAYNCHADPAIQSEALLTYLASLPGLGLVKGGFVAQCAFGLVGCLDTHNINRYGLKKSQLSAYSYKSAKTGKAKQSKVRTYLGLCDDLGGCESLWDSWCAYVADNNRFGTNSTAYEISKLHCDALGLKV